uniref:Uncharacterized protein n=1 Tax=Avena sativa TaxID=4498 RepID=A0ACD5YJ07_AVESA
MGSSEADAPAKASKASIPQEQQPPATSSAATPVVYPDWTNFQGYSPIPPHGFFPSPVVSSPQGHPYMWGPQPMMPPYGTPPYVIYPPGGIYAHPSMPPYNGLETIKEAPSFEYFCGYKSEAFVCLTREPNHFDYPIVQDERELKRQKRKQSNRDSARRSRLRKQAECEELAQRADVLKQENTSLRDEVNRIRKEYDLLISKNSSLKDKLGDEQYKTDEAGLDNEHQHSGG